MRIRRLTLVCTVVIGLFAVAGAVAFLVQLNQVVHAGHVQQTTVRYVSTTGSDTSNDCTDNSSPCQTVQHAVDEANSEDEIRLAAGVYSEISVRPRADVTSTGWVSQVAYISKTVTLRGGYSLADWEASDPKANPTTLHAQNKGRVLYVTGNILPTIDGLQITGGDASGLGGDMWGNDLGGGVYVISATATITNSRVAGNSAYRGGGLSLYRSSSTVAGNSISDNTASGGAGLYAGYGESEIISNTITNNIGGWNSGGGGVYLDYEDRSTLISNTITTNTAGDGGGVFSKGSTELLNNMIVGNSAYNWGGGLYLNGTTVLEGNRIADNDADSAGGGVCVVQAFVTANRITVEENEAPEGGGLYLFFYADLYLFNSFVTDNEATLLGSGLYAYGSDADLRYTTLARNYGGDGSGVRLDKHYIGATSEVQLSNTILVSHTVGVEVSAGNTATLEATLWGGDEWANGVDWEGTGTVVTGTANFWGAPDFLDPDIGDYHIGENSAAIDHGIDIGIGIDFDGDARPIGPAPDIGADEYFYCYAATGVTITGPTEGVTDTLLSFAGSVTPTGTTNPITYTWSPAPADGQGTDSASYIWDIPDEYTLTLTAENCGGVVSDTHTIVISSPEDDFVVYLPTVLKE